MFNWFFRDVESLLPGDFVSFPPWEEDYEVEKTVVENDQVLVFFKGDPLPVAFFSSSLINSCRLDED